MKPSRLLLRLEAGIANAKSVIEADCLRAERAAYLARLGRFEEVNTELAALRERYDSRPNVEISAWVNFVEGLEIYFSGTGAPKTDKLKRSLALSFAAGLNSLQALNAAWLAQMDYARFDMDSMASNVRKSLQLAKPEHHSARSRAALVVAQALHLAGRQDLAIPWYRCARDHAVADGDDATTSALMHNIGWLRMMALRQATLSGKPIPFGGALALASADSTTHFDLLTGDSSWAVLKPILRAQILSLEGKFSEALDLYEVHLSSVDSEGIVRLRPYLLADKAWCLAKSGESILAGQCAASSSEGICFDIHIDDRAATHSRLSQVFSIILDDDNGNIHAQLARDAWTIHETIQEHIILLLSKLSETGLNSD